MLVAWKGSWSQLNPKVNITHWINLLNWILFNISPEHAWNLTLNLNIGNPNYYFICKGGGGITSQIKIHSHINTLQNIKTQHIIIKLNTLFNHYSYIVI